MEWAIQFPASSDRLYLLPVSLFSIDFGRAIRYPASAACALAPELRLLGLQLWAGIPPLKNSALACGPKKLSVRVGRRVFQGGRPACSGLSAVRPKNVCLHGIC